MELLSFVNLPLSWTWKPCRRQGIDADFTLAFPVPFLIFDREVPACVS